MLVDPAAAQIQRIPGVAHLVMCHHPFNWIRNGQPFENRVNSVTKIQLFGHEHTERVDEGKYCVRIRAGALQPARDEKNWKPGYNWLDVSTHVDDAGKRSLIVRIHVRMHENDHFLTVTDPANRDVWEESFELPAWQPQPEAPPPIPAPIAEKIASEALEVPMTSTPSIRSVITKIFRLKEHEQRRLIVMMSLDREGDRDLKDYEVAISAVHRAAEDGALGQLDAAIEALLAQGVR